MDLRMFYQKLRKLEQEIVQPHVVVISQETSDGGKAGQKAEVSRVNAARLLLEGRARLASAEETTEYRKIIDQALQDAEQRAISEKVHVNVISDADLRAIKNAARPEKR
jgi:uncharacterized Fe-S cluster-containing radical SAM superfamily enzyme